MRIALLNPNANAQTTALMADIARAAAPDHWVVEPVTAETGAPLITTQSAYDVAAEAVGALAPRLKGFDAVIVSAFGDPGRDALRKALPCPVIGLAEAAMSEADQLSRSRFAIATTTPKLDGRIRALAKAYGYQDGLVSIHYTRSAPFALTADTDRLVEELADCINAAQAEDGARAAIIGGGPLAVAARALAPQFAIPIVEPVPAAIRALMQI